MAGSECIEFLVSASDLWYAPRDNWHFILHREQSLSARFPTTLDRAKQCTFLALNHPAVVRIPSKTQREQGNGRKWHIYLERMPAIAALSNENGAKPTVSAAPFRCTFCIVSALLPRDNPPATRSLAAAFFSPSGWSKCTILRNVPWTGPMDGDRVVAELVSIRAELLSADGAARKRLTCSCAYGQFVQVKGQLDTWKAMGVGVASLQVQRVTVKLGPTNP